jgi:hypothetical protein
MNGEKNQRHRRTENQTNFLVNVKEKRSREEGGFHHGSGGPG